MHQYSLMYFRKPYYKNPFCRLSYSFCVPIFMVNKLKIYEGIVKVLKEYRAINIQEKEKKVLFYLLKHQSLDRKVTLHD